MTLAVECDVKQKNKSKINVLAISITGGLFVHVGPNDVVVKGHGSTARVIFGHYWDRHKGAGL